MITLDFHKRTDAWRRIITNMRSDYGAQHPNKSMEDFKAFKEWIQATYNIKFTYIDDKADSFITGLEVDDLMYTLLLLKYS